MSCEEKFNAAVSVIRSLPKNGSYQPSKELMLRFYGFYKQATEGPAKEPRPSFWDVVKRAKWDAWHRLGKISRQDAMTAYVDELNKIVETMAFTDNVADFLSSLDSFTAHVPVEDLEMCIGPALEKVRSQPGSPLAGTPLGSRDTSPVRCRIPSIDIIEQDEDEEDFLDSIEQAEPDSRSKPEPVKKHYMVNGNADFIKETKILNGFHDPRKHIETAVSEALQKAVESLRRDLTSTNNRLQALEHHLVKKTNSPKLYGGLTKEVIIFIIAWPLVTNFLMYRYMRRRT